MNDNLMDDLFKEAVDVCCQYDRASASLLQRRLSIGYARAARLIDLLQDAGVIASSDGTSKPREVLIKSYKDLKIKEKEEEKKQIQFVPAVNYIPTKASFLPSEVLNLKDSLDLPFINFNLSKVGNLIVTGNVISKKYEFIKTYLTFILSKFDLNYVNLIISDDTGNLIKFSKVPHLLTPIITEWDKNTSTLRWLSFEMQRRIEILNKDDEAKFPAIVFIGNYIGLSSIEAEDSLKRISSMGAYAKIHLILLSDRLGDVSKMIKDNIPARLEFDKFGKYKAVFHFDGKNEIEIKEMDQAKVKKYLELLF